MSSKIEVLGSYLSAGTHVDVSANNLNLDALPPCSSCFAEKCALDVPCTDGQLHSGVFRMFHEPVSRHGVDVNSHLEKLLYYRVHCSLPAQIARTCACANQGTSHCFCSIRYPALQTTGEMSCTLERSW